MMPPQVLELPRPQISGVLACPVHLLLEQPQVLEARSIYEPHVHVRMQVKAPRVQAGVHPELVAALTEGLVVEGAVKQAVGVVLALAVAAGLAVVKVG
jgi:hypothetical protein